MYTKTIKLSAEKTSLQQCLLSAIIEALILTKENKGTGMERWKGGTDWERDSHCGFAWDQTLRKLVLLCMRTCADHTESLQNHEPEARQPLRVWPCPSARSPVPTHNRCVPASGVRVQPECRCASHGRPRLRFGRLGTRCWAARSPPMHEQEEMRWKQRPRQLAQPGYGW